MRNNISTTKTTTTTTTTANSNMAYATPKKDREVRGMRKTLAAEKNYIQSRLTSSPEKKGSIQIACSRA